MINSRKTVSKHPSSVQQPVQHQTERIYIHRRVIRLVVVDLRRHEFVGADLRSARRVLHRSRYAEVAEFIFSVIRDEDVLRLYVTVDDAVLLAQDQ